MGSRTCPAEPGLVRALKNGHHPEELWNHLRGCERCQDALAVSEWFEATTDADVARSLPDPGRIYWRAQLQHRRAMAHRATHAIRLLEQVTIAVASAAALIGCVLAWPALSRAARDVSDLAAITSPSSVMNLTVATALLVVAVVFAWCAASFDEA